MTQRTIISTNIITPAILNAGQIDSTSVADDSITTAKVQNSAITDAKIENGTIQNQSIADNTIEPVKISKPGYLADAVLTFDYNTNSLVWSQNYTFTEEDWDARLATKDTDDLSEGTTNLYYTDSRVATWFSTTGLGLLSTDVVSEGSTNLYHTDARAISAVEGEATLDLSGVVTVTGNTSTKTTTISDFDVLGTYASHGLLIEADETSWAGMNFTEYVGGASKPFNAFANPFINAEVWGGTPSAKAECPSGKRLLAISGTGAVDNSGTIEMPTSAPARIIAETTETQTTSGRGTKVYINTTPNGSTTRSTTATFQGDNTTLINLIASGTVVLSNLPTSDPSNPGQLWNDGGTLKVS
jgi:hypothetical protein